MSGTIGPLQAADEQFTHQVVETFASVGQSDLARPEFGLSSDEATR